MDEFHERGAATGTEDNSPSYRPEVLFRQRRLGEGDDVIQENWTGSGAALNEADYVSMSTLTLSQLPLPIRSEAVLEAIRAVGARVVRVSVNTLSPARRGTFADLGDLDSGISRGTGFAVFIHTLFIIVSTNRHVVFDDFEARHSTIEFFADDKDNWLQDVRFFQGHGVISAHSDQDFALVVYWLQRGKSSHRWDPESVRRHKDLTPFCFPHLAYTHATSTTGEEDKGTSDTSGHVSPDAGAEPNPTTGKAETSAAVTKSSAIKYVCVIAHPEGETKQVSFGKILQENDVTQEVSHTAPTSDGSSGAPILIFSPSETDVPPDSIWYHCGKLRGTPETKLARLQPNTGQLFAVEFNRGLVGWKLLSDLLDKLQPRQDQPQASDVAGKGEPQEKTKELPPAADPSSGDVTVTNFSSGLTVACKLLTWIYSAGEATLRRHFPDLIENSPSQHSPLKSQPPPSSSSLSAEPPTSPSPQPPDQACLVSAFRKLVCQVDGLLGDEKVDSLMHPVSFLTLAKAVKDLHSAVHSHDPCCCPDLALCEDVPVLSAGLAPQATPSASGPATPLPGQESRMGCVLQGTLELLSAFLSDPGVTVLESLPVLNLLFRLATHLVRVVVLHQALDKTRMLTTGKAKESKEAKEGKEAALGSRPEGGLEAVSTAAENDDEKDEGGQSGDGRLDADLNKRSLVELTAIFSDCFGSFLSISDAWSQANQGWTETNTKEATNESSGDLISENLESGKDSKTCLPNSRLVVQKKLKALQGKLQKSCSSRAKSTTPTDSPSPSAAQQEEEAKTIAVMAAIINAFPYMYRGLDDSRGRKNVCQRFQAVQGGDRSQEISRLQGELESVLQAAHGVLTLATSAWEGLQKIEDDSTQESTPEDQGSSAANQEVAKSGAAGNSPPKKRKVCDGDRENADRGNHVSSSSEQATAHPPQPEDQLEATKVQTAAKEQQPSTPTTGIGFAKQSEFPPPSEPEHQIFFHLCMIGFATLLESGSSCTALMRFQEQLARAPGVAELREKLRRSGGRTMMQGWMGAVSLDAFSPEDERFKACPELFTEISRFGRNILVEGIRQLSDMRSADVPSIDNVVARARAAKEAMARQTAQKQEAEVDAGSSSSTPEAAETEGKGGDTSQDPATERRHGPKAGVDVATEGQAADSQDKDAALQDKVSSAGFLETTVNTYKDVLKVMQQPEVLQNLPQAMAPFQPRAAAQTSQSQVPPSTKP